ncbi:hypothetical protein CNBJ0290 [Cryptococcus deneoformans B-3501A]|uniref:Expressed protein n=1 Tax=Cryptococcus deneoformans (strain JEC21 / ATCC MYA-565) TaxID=214684 RepID=Q5KA39_CRYD1|nr:expressed protein [Cryptococcus neoformans var. neoformans JEC21]XP_773251.1 hypothetical protein CNBJ0290 [Cryptococcus neoformans var. neoformans B-3501A]AAW45880.1 expressed protein [Cryptococcus neoformans var. neoformans JEC21]EAL18604.1 hypothetical protein CNBJ0290 [Cryptococcus neoformans var. neoformans B-3501A]
MPEYTFTRYLGSKEVTITEVGDPQDRINPRPLTKDELWASFEDKFDPNLAKSKAKLLSNAVPTQYPPRRTTYHLLPNTVALQKQAIRSFKLRLRDRIQCNAFGEDEAGVMRDFLRVQRNLDATEEKLSRDIDDQQGLRKDVNALFQEGKFEDAKFQYNQLWSEILPWHIEALPEHSPLRLKLGEVEAAMFDNMAACMFKLAKADFEFHSVFQCCWTAIDVREYAKVRPIYSCCRRASDMMKILYVDARNYPFEINFDRNETPPDQKYVAQMIKYFDDQANALQNLNKEAWYKDIDERLKIPMPPGEVTYYFGPFSWRDSWKEKRDTPSNPAQTQPRDLTLKEMWEVWSPVPKQTHLEYNDLPPYYPESRITYELRPTGIVQEYRYLTYAKFSIYEMIWRQHNEDWSRIHFQEDDKKRRQVSVEDPPLKIRLDKAEKQKDEANKKYKANEFKDALMTYADAWYQLLPYHIEALPLANPLRQKLGQIEAALFANMAAVLIKASSEQQCPRRRRERFRRLAFFCSWAAWYNKELATVGTVINSAKRCYSTAPSDKDSHGAIESLNNSFWTPMINILGEIKARNDMLLQEVLERGLKYNTAPQVTLQQVGPRKWYETGELEDLKKERNWWN